MAAKHADDVYVPECKTGPSGEGMQRMDAWVMAKSWAHPLVTAYEIKVSRSDFLHDNKWQGYLDYCNSFYFACPKGLIKPEELPDYVGLIWISDKATTAYTKRKAVYRDVVIPQEVFRYILMCRTRIDAEMVNRHDKQYWTTWLENRKLDYEFGWRVAKSIRETVEHKIDEVERRNKNLEAMIDRYRDIKQLVNTLGFDEHDIKSWSFRDRLTQKLEEVKTGVGKDLVRYLSEVKHNVELAVEVLNKPMLDTGAGKVDNVSNKENCHEGLEDK